MTDQSRASEPRHPIGVVAERTGLSQDVLRVWERRYAAVSPGRGRGGQRLYSDADIDRLRLLALATGAGRSIGQVVPLPTGELEVLVREDGSTRAADARLGGTAASIRVESLADQAVELARTYDAAALDAALRRAVTVMGVHPFLESVAAPLLRRVGDEWHAGRLTPAQEHLASAVVQRVITSVMHAFPVPGGAAHIVVATPLGERHELGAILAAASAVAEGWRVTYLGSDLPAAEIANVAIVTGARAVGVSVVYPADAAAVVDELRSLRARLPASVTLIVGGEGALGLAAELARAGVVLVSSLSEFRARLGADATRPAA